MFEAELLDVNGDLKRKLTGRINVDWEYLRTGGCGQANVSTPYKVGGEVDLSIAPGDELSLKIDNDIRYCGKLLKISRRISSGDEGVDLMFYGYMTELSEVIINETFENMEISDIVKAILDEKIVGVKKVTYDDADIDESGFSVASITFNHDVLSALSFLGDLAGNMEWGVDSDKRFYFKRADTNVRRTYHIGRDILEYQEVEDHEAVKNVAYVYGSTNELLATLMSGGSVTTFGRREINIFESSISEPSDGNRLGIVNVKNLDNRARRINVRLAKDDHFIEESHPFGAVAIVLEPFSSPQKYGNNFKYGRNKKYGSLKQDQISVIKYVMSGGGLDVSLVVSQDIVNAGDQQKQVELQIKDLQRR